MDGAELGRAYTAVLAAELIADRSIFSVGALATRFRLGWVFTGLMLGYLVKSCVAVMFGGTLRLVPSAVVTLLGAAALVWGGFLLLRQDAKTKPEPAAAARGRGIGATFATVFFSEWGDLGQLATAFVASRSSDLVAVWLGSALALITKGTVAALLVASLRRVLPARPMIRFGAAVCFVMAVLTLLGVKH